MSIFSNCSKAFGSFFDNPYKAICSSLGVNHKKKVIVDVAQQSRADEITCIRNNNLYVQKAKKQGLFGELEELIDYKEWLLLNGPENINSPYFLLMR